MSIFAVAGTPIPQAMTNPAVTKLQAALAEMPQIQEFKTTHRFADGMYIREMNIHVEPGTCGTTIVSRTHRKECLFILLRGDLTINTGSEVHNLLGGDVLVAPPGKRAVTTVFGCTALTVHRLDPPTTDLAEIEAQLIVPEPSVYDMDNKLKDRALAASDRKALE